MQCAQYGVCEYREFRTGIANPRPEWSLALKEPKELSTNDYRPTTMSRGLVVHEAFELSGSDGVLEFADGLGLDLADAYRETGIESSIAESWAR